MTAAKCFDADTWVGIDESKKFDYNPTRYTQMVKQLGAVETQSGFCITPSLAYPVRDNHLS